MKQPWNSYDSKQPSLFSFDTCYIEKDQGTGRDFSTEWKPSHVYRSCVCWNEVCSCLAWNNLTDQRHSRRSSRSFGFFTLPLICIQDLPAMAFWLRRQGRRRKESYTGTCMYNVSLSSRMVTYAHLRKEWSKWTEACVAFSVFSPKLL